jgi:hypothetical protein
MRLKSVIRGFCLFAVGGLGYVLIELCWRKRTHWSMFLVGGICFRLIGEVFCKFAKYCLAVRCFLSALLITVVEFFSGCLLNIIMKMQVWDYTNRAFNIKGQVCLLYSFFWLLLSIPAGYLYGFCKRFICRQTDKNAP